MTVTEAIIALQKLQMAGHGDLKVFIPDDGFSTPLAQIEVQGDIVFMCPHD